MKQTLATLLVTVLLLVSLVGCGEKKGNNTVTPPPAATDHDTADNSRKSHDTPGADRRNAAASASDRSRYFGSDKTITHENGNLFGKTYLIPETEKSANAQLRSNGRS